MCNTNIYIYKHTRCWTSQSVSSATICSTRKDTQVAVYNKNKMQTQTLQLPRIL